MVLYSYQYQLLVLFFSCIFQFIKSIDLRNYFELLKLQALHIFHHQSCLFQLQYHLLLQILLVIRINQKLELLLQMLQVHQIKILHYIKILPVLINFRLIQIFYQIMRMLVLILMKYQELLTHIHPLHKMLLNFLSYLIL